MAKKIYEGRWDCNNCLTKENLGRYGNCPECGDPRTPDLDPSETPYLPADAKPITNADLINQAKSGPSIRCGTCGEANSKYTDGSQAKRTGFCGFCGDPIDGDDVTSDVIDYVTDSESVGRKLDPIIDPDEYTPINEDDSTDIEEAEALLAGMPLGGRTLVKRFSEMPRSGLDYVSDRRSRVAAQPKVASALGTVKAGYDGANKAIVAGIVVALLVIVAIYNLFIATHEVRLEVEAMTWERAVEVEELRTLSEEAWSVPRGGRQTDSFEAVHHYDRVQTGSRTETYSCGGSSGYSGSGGGGYGGGSSGGVSGGGGGYGSGGGGSTDLGNGFFTGAIGIDLILRNTCTRQVPTYTEVPVYQTKYRYDIDRWVTDYWSTSDGERGDTNYRDPFWDTPSSLSDKHRVGDERKATYVIEIAGPEEGQEWIEEVSFNVWVDQSLDDELVGHKTRTGNLRRVDWVNN